MNSLYVYVGPSSMGVNISVALSWLLCNGVAPFDTALLITKSS